MHLQRETLSLRQDRTRGGLTAALILWLAAAISSAATYAHVPTTFSWIDPSGHTPAVWSSPSLCQGFGDTIGDDAITAPVNIGFSFTYGGTSHTQLNIMTNGRLMFAGNTQCGAGTQTTGPPRFYTLPYPDGNLQNTMKIYGADLDAEPERVGAGRNRRPAPRRAAPSPTRLPHWGARRTASSW